ncbi:Retrovirus-related Pol polyprotein from transposon, partial [Aduncisulcus paluster]
SEGEFFSPIVIVPKKGGKLRLCIDFRDLNKVTTLYPHPLPRLDDCLGDLGGCIYFATLDLSKGFHQIPLENKSADLTSFKTPSGLFKYEMMPFGLVNAPSHFQFVMNRVLQGLIVPVCLVYIDDVLIFGKSKDEFTINLELVLNRIKAYGLKLNPKKCLIGFQSLEFLGFVISKFGKEISPSRILFQIALLFATTCED